MAINIEKKLQTVDLWKLVGELENDPAVSEQDRLASLQELHAYCKDGKNKGNIRIWQAKLGNELREADNRRGPDHLENACDRMMNAIFRLANKPVQKSSEELQREQQQQLLTIELDNYIGERSESKSKKFKSAIGQIAEKLGGDKTFTGADKKEGAELLKDLVANPSQEKLQNILNNDSVAAKACQQGDLKAIFDKVQTFVNSVPVSNSSAATPLRKESASSSSSSSSSMLGAAAASQPSSQPVEEHKPRGPGISSSG